MTKIDNKKVCCADYSGDIDRVRVELPEGSTHGAKLVCKHCKKHLSWAPKQATLDRMYERDEKIKKRLASEEGLTEKSRAFLNNMLGQTKMSFRQKIYLEGLIG